MSAAVVSLLFWKWTFGDGVACGHGGARSWRVQAVRGVNYGPEVCQKLRI